MSLECPLCSKDILEDEKYYSFFCCRECDETFDMPEEEKDQFWVNTKLVETGSGLVNGRKIKAKDKCYG